MNNTTAQSKRTPLKLGGLSAMSKIVVEKPKLPPDRELELSTIYSRAQVRTKFRKLEELAESLKLNGMIEPIVVHEEPDGRYRIIVGERRFRAAPIAGMSRVPVIIKRGLSELEIRRMQISENNDRDNLTAFEQAMGVIADVSEYGVQEAMKIWNVNSEGWISKRVAVQRYVDPVRSLLEDELCGDFEVLHSLNQLYALSVDEFNHMMKRLKEGLPLSRDEARNKVAAVKVFQRERDELAKRRTEAPPAPVKTAAARSGKDEPSAAAPARPTGSASPKKAPQNLEPAMESAPADADAAPSPEADMALQRLREDVFEWGEANLVHFNDLKEKTGDLGLGMTEATWVLWSGFLSTVLPVMRSLGDETALLFLKKLQGELKTHKAEQLWEQLHSVNQGAREIGQVGDRDKAPSMPASWRF